jgi:hypothetical protein
MFFTLLVYFMEQTFAIKVAGLERYLVVPDCEDCNVCLTECFEGDTSQLWFQDDQGLIKWAERPKMFLIQDDNADNEHKAKLTKDTSKLNSKWKCQWVVTSGSRQYDSKSEEDPNNLYERVYVQLPRPATSCHLCYGPELPRWIHDIEEWTLECSVVVEKSVDCTYFMVVGWSPGGYSGIQQLPGNKRKAIFSMWNDGTSSVEAVKAGPGVDISTFGGEGTGIKSMCDADWKEGDLVTFRVNASLNDGYWFVSCLYSLNSQDYWHLMAVLKRKKSSSRPLLYPSGFYSFIEDWDRCQNASGWRHLRKASYFKPKLYNGVTKECYTLTKATFTKVESGSDAFAADLAKACPLEGGFGLQTGQEPVCPNYKLIQSLSTAAM